MYVLVSEQVQTLRHRLAKGPALLLDGALGTELERAGIACTLPLWSAQALWDAPDAVRAIHLAYLEAGAEILTANTFRTQAYTLAKIGRGEQAASLTQLAVRLAREAIQVRRTACTSMKATQPTIWIAGSCPPLEDCFRPDLVPDERTLFDHHLQHASTLAEAGVDFLLIETMNTSREARAALRAAREVSLPAMVSFCVTPNAYLPSGESLEETLAYYEREETLALLINCMPPRVVASCLTPLRNTGQAFGLYPNFGPPKQGEREWQDALSPEAFCSLLAPWAEAGARVLGGCCGTQPVHIRALACARLAGAPPPTASPVAS